MVHVDLGDTSIAVHEWRTDDPVATVVFWHGLGATASGAELVEIAPRLAATDIDVFVQPPVMGSPRLANF